MKMPVVVGVILALMFFVSFSGWFYNLVSGMKQLVLDDKFFGMRIVGTTIASFTFMIIVFVGIATVSECKNEKREGVFASLRCEEYLSIRSSTKELFQLK
jgi:hypothetical protein